jgi:hypothetical protein
MDSTAHELLTLYDELTALHACNAFITRALAAALVQGGGLDDRSATGAGFCTQWLNDRTVELERQFKIVVSRVYTPESRVGAENALPCSSKP